MPNPKEADLIAAMTSFSTLADSFSIKTDDLVTKIDLFLAAVDTADLSPAAQAALTAMQGARDNLAAHGDKIDLEIKKLDEKLLPTPAPAGTLAPA